MRTLMAALAASAFAFAGASLHAADEPVQSVKPTDTQQPGGANDPASAERKHQTQDGVKAGGAPAATTSGRENDPCSAERGTGAAGGNVKCNPEDSAREPGRENDPAAAERRK